MAASSTVQYIANVSFLGSLGLTIFLAVSLQAMWNLMHVMQIMAFLRQVVSLPANSNMMLDSVHEAITLENFNKELYNTYLPEIGITMFMEEENEEQSNEDDTLDDY